MYRYYLPISNVNVPPLAISQWSMYGLSYGLPLSETLLMYMFSVLLFTVSIVKVPLSTVSTALSTTGEPNQ